ncbi:MAG: hypothetical protein AB1540_12630 [Bdellovibrionota bacterium]
MGLGGFASGCKSPTDSTDGSSTASGASSRSSTTSGSGVTSSTSSIYAFQVITKAGSSTGSFDGASVPAGGGIAVRAQRIFALDGGLISSANTPTWFSESRVFLTSTRTAGTANPAAPSTSNTPCAYFDSSTTDYNPDTSGFYTIDGYNSTTTTNDIDQCAGANAAELSRLGMYITLDRRFLASDEKINVIIKAKPIDAPNTAPTSTSCVVGGNFDASACSNQYFAVSLRSSPTAATRPYYILFPSAKALDLLSESVLIPLKIDANFNTISIDRVKGGAVIYGVTVIRL